MEYDTYVSCRVHMFGPSRAAAVPKIITVTIAVSRQTVDLVPADRYMTLNLAIKILIYRRLDRIIALPSRSFANVRSGKKPVVDPT